MASSSDVMVGRRDPRRRVSVSPTTAERAKINAVGRNRVTAAVARVGFLAHGGARSQDAGGRGGKTAFGRSFQQPAVSGQQSAVSGQQPVVGC